MLTTAALVTGCSSVLVDPSHGSGGTGGGDATSSSAGTGGSSCGAVECPKPPVATSISAGGLHTCAVVNHVTKCWGRNSLGQLGNGSTTDSFAPVEVTGLGSGALAVSAGGVSSCAVTSTGAIACWGFNAYGQLGSNSVLQSAVPVAVTGPGSGVLAVSVGSDHACAITSAGGLECWGSNGWGALGNSSMNAGGPTPVDVTGLGSGVVAVSAGFSHSCAITSTGAVKCWGYNGHGELGITSATISSATPLDVSGLGGGAVAVSAGSEHTCALTAAGAVKCWGHNSFGELGDSSTTDSFAPVDVMGLGSGVLAISAGAARSCALTAEGGVKCWGANASGQLGDGSTIDSSFPVQVAGLESGVVAISAGAAHSCAITSAGAVRCWGFNQWGMLGDGTPTTSLVPVEVTGL